MSNSNDIEPSFAELLLVDMLYGELVGDDETAARDVVEKDEDLIADAEAYRNLRAMMRELPDEEPPAAITAQLLHAAAAHASARSKAMGGGFLPSLKRFFRPVMMHPAMATAATFVLVAGVAGALYLSGRVGVTDEVPSSAPSASAPTSVTPEEIADRAEVDLPVSSFDEDIVIEAKLEPFDKKPADESGRAITEDRKAGERPKAEPKVPAETAGDGWDYGSNIDDGSYRRPAGKKGPAKKPAKKPDRTPHFGEGESVVTGTSGQVIVVDTEVPPVKKLEEKAKPSEKERQLAMVQQWHIKAVQAAKDGECKAVIEIGKRIRKLDSRYYDTVYLRDKRLNACRRQSPNTHK